MARNIESKVAETILQKSIKVEGGGKSYIAPSPTLATLLLVSEKIADLPKEFGQDGSAAGILRDTRNARILAEICSIYILGAKIVIKEEQHGKFKPFSLLHTNHHPKYRNLTKEILENWTPNELNVAFTRFLEGSDLRDFFGVSTFLREVNLTKPTKVENETTASGR